MTRSRKDIDDSGIDYSAVFRALPVPALLLTPDLVIADVSDAFEDVLRRPRRELVGQNVLAAFPHDPADPVATGPVNLADSIRRVLGSGQAEAMPLQRYDIEAADSPGDFRERYWCPANSPVRGSDGEVAAVVHVVEEVPDLIRKFVDAEAAGS